MIFKAIIIPTPKRIKKYFEEAMIEFNTASLKRRRQGIKTY